MSIKGYELMKLVAENSDKYSNKTYKVVEGHARTPSGVDRKEINVNSIGNFEDYDGVSLYISTRTELEEIKQPVTPQEAREAHINGKVVTVKLPNFSCNIPKGDFGHCFSANTFMDIVSKGTWYIED